MKEKTDEELMVLYAQEASEEAFLQLYQRYAGKIYGFLQKRTSGSLDMEAIFQETFLKLHTAKRRYSSEFPFSAWIFTICRNLLIDHARKNLREQKGSRKIKEEQDLEIVESPTGRDERLKEAIASLPLVQKKAVELRFLQELPYEAISKNLQKSEGNVRKIVSRGIFRLKTLLTKSDMHKELK